MSARKINVGGFTPKQALDVYNYVMETTLEAKQKKGEDIYRAIKRGISLNFFDRTRAFSGIEQRFDDEVPDVGDYINTYYDESDRAGVRSVLAWQSQLEERFMQSQGEKPQGNQGEENGKDPFSARISRIAKQYYADQINDSTSTDDNTDIMYGKDIAFAEKNNQDREEYGTEEDESNLAYGIFTERDLEEAEDVVPTAHIDPNTLHGEKLKEVFTGRCTDIIDTMDINHLEKVLSENRLNAKSTVILAIGALEKATSAKIGSINYYGKIHSIMRRLESSCCQLLNLDLPAKQDSESTDQASRFTNLMDNCMRRKDYTWSQVNNAQKNQALIDYVMQHTLELTVLLDIQGEENKNLIDDGTN